MRKYILVQNCPFAKGKVTKGDLCMQSIVYDPSMVEPVGVDAAESALCAQYSVDYVVWKKGHGLWH